MRAPLEDAWEPEGLGVAFRRTTMRAPLEDAWEPEGLGVAFRRAGVL
jgi:hypothetical protein